LGRLKELCVEHLKTTGYYSNIRVGLCYELSEGDNPDQVFDELFTQINVYIGRAQKLSETSQFAERVKEQLAELEGALGQVQELLERIKSLTSDVKDLRDELVEAVEEIEEAKEQVHAAHGRLAAIKAGLKELVLKLKGLAG